jgi:NAD(P)-dependent dehydrogenase (short-subunit alcohol dehydrogenase family)
MAGAVVLGAGPGIGRSVACRFAGAGMPVAVVARSLATVTAVAEAVRASVAPGPADVLALTADVTDEDALRAALDAAVDRFGVPDVVVYNAAVVRADALGELTTRGQIATWTVNVLAALSAATHVLPGMAARGSGSFLLTGGMPEPRAEYVSLSLGKAGLRALTAMLAERYGPLGVHVATVTVAGPVAPGTAWDPDEIAEHYWRLHRQSRPEWTREVVH